MSSVLSDLLGEMSLDAFVEQFYLRLPVARSAARSSWRDLANWSTLDRLIEHPDANVIIGRQGERWPGGLPRREQIQDVLAQAYTIGIRHAERIDDGLLKLAKEFGAVFPGPLDVQMYATPANQVGFGWHYDAEEVFILQTLGSKQWWLRKNTVNPWPLIDNIPADQRYEREIMPALHCQLNEGDWLYIPSGYWHRTQADAASISLSVGVRAWTALDLFDALRPVLAESILWRQRLPSLTATGTAADGLGQNLKDLAESLSADLAQQFQSPAFLQNAIGHFRSGG